MIKPVVHDPAALQTPAQTATRADLPTVTNLLDTLSANSASCVGMAANMIGVNKRIIVVQMGPLAIPMINPQIINKTGSYQTSEGCLSLSGERPTTRYHQITVKFVNQNFAPQQQTFRDFVAQIIQHEVDHCNGILI